MITRINSVRNFQSMKSPVDLNSLFSKLFSNIYDKDFFVKIVNKFKSVNPFQLNNNNTRKMPRNDHLRSLWLTCYRFLKLGIKIISMVLYLSPTGYHIFKINRKKQDNNPLYFFKTVKGDNTRIFLVSFRYQHC